MSDPWGENLPWKTEKEYLQWLRSSVRRIWSKHLTKIAYKQSRRYKAPVGRNNKEVFVSDCELCGTQSRSCEVDHLSPGGSFSNWEEFCAWSRRILWVGFDDIRELCVPCHEIVTHSQKKGMTFEEAKKDKEIVAICKTTASQKKWLIENGIVPLGNSEQRKKQIREKMNE